VITYEYPLNERIRTLLRLEDLFDKTAHFGSADGAQEHHVALVTLFEILDVASRADLKFDLVQELERQRQILLSFRNNPDIFGAGAVRRALRNRAGQFRGPAGNMQGKIGHYLRENDWLMSIKSRASIPGGVCEFDLPSYHYWLHRDAALRQQRPRRLARADAADPRRAGHRAAPAARLRPQEEQTAPHGAYQLMLGGRTAQLIRLKTGAGEPCLPEISAGKFAVNIRFLRPDMDQRPRQIDSTVNFELTLCNL
jgi:cell division protein ZapD